MSWQDCAQQRRVAAILHQSVLNNRVAHAYLFAGGQGSGKRKLAMQLAKVLMCLTQSGDSCGVCHQCLRIDSGNHPDVHWISPDGASIKIEQVRGLQKEFSYRAVESTRKIYVLEHADKMTVPAANSLLKFLEEPSSEVTAILLTEHPHQILPTILSRTQVITLDELSYENRVSLLQSEGLYEPLLRNACQLTADLVRIRELCQSEWFAQYRNLVLQLNEDILDKGSYALITLQEKVMKLEQGNQGLAILLDLLLYWYRDILFHQINRKQDLTNSDQQDAIQKQALRCSSAWLINGMEAILEAKNRLSRNANPQLTLERMIIRIQEV